jgi:hypothetical protein
VEPRFLQTKMPNQENNTARKKFGGAVTLNANLLVGAAIISDV